MKAVMGYETPEWPAEDKWKSKILKLIQDIFTVACPRLPSEFSLKMTRLFTAYASGFIPRKLFVIV